MEQRRLGSSDLDVPVLAFGTGTFGGAGPLFGAWGQSNEVEARRLVDICLEAGVTLFDTADAYSGGAAEQILGSALKGRRHKALIATKIGLPNADDDPNAAPAQRLTAALERSLQRLGTDHVDLLQLHAFDARIPPEILLDTLDAFVKAGKARHIGVSNYPSWRLMQSLAITDQGNHSRFCSHQVYYSLIGRGYEAELMPLGIDQQVGALAWSPLGWGRLTGKLKRGAPLPAGSRLHKTSEFAPPVPDELLFGVIDALHCIAEETGRTVPQVAINWLLQRPTVTSVILGARNEAQLRDNLGAAGWTLSHEQMRRLDDASQVLPDYPHTLYWQQGPFRQLNPPPVP
ncbi:MAG: aldo/keto reductase [Betaproteobacteria bacterium]|nr:aldo/keto reductase [Betaproteobacteria bacterium]